MPQIRMQENNMVVYRGDDFSTQLTFADEEGEPIDITGWKIFFTVKKNKDDSDIKARIAVDVEPTDPTTGVVLVTVSHTLTSTLAGFYYYDFQFTKADGTVQTITGGGITFERDITRRVS